MLTSEAFQSDANPVRPHRIALISALEIRKASLESINHSKQYLLNYQNNIAEKPFAGKIVKNTMINNSTQKKSCIRNCFIESQSTALKQNHKKQQDALILMKLGCEKTLLTKSNNINLILPLSSSSYNAQDLQQKRQTNLQKVEKQNVNVKSQMNGRSTQYESKYRKMVDQYQHKKRAINNQLNLLKAGKLRTIDDHFSSQCLQDLSTDRTPKFSENNRERINSFSMKKIIINTETSSISSTQWKPQRTQKLVSNKMLDNRVIKKDYVVTNQNQHPMKKSFEGGNSKIKSKKDTNLKKFAIFVRAINDQIDREEAFRHQRHLIQESDKKQLANILKTNYQIFEDLTTLEPQEFDPFANCNKEVDLPKLAKRLQQLHIDCEQNWKESIQNAFDHDQLLEIFEIMSGEKGQCVVSLNCFVRQLGILTQNSKYFRSRDVLKIYKRLSPFTSHNFLKVLAKKS